MKNLKLAAFIFSILFIFQACQKEDHIGKDLRIICEDFRPYNYVQDGQLKGICADLTGEIIGRMGLESMDVEITSDWSSAIQLLETEQNVALFTTMMTPERKTKFQWVGPLTIIKTGFVALNSAGLHLSGLDAARALASVGVVKDYGAVELLEQQNFTNLIEFNNLDEAIQALYEGNVKCLFDITNSIRLTATDAGKNADLLEDLFTYASLQGFIAFSKGVSSKLIESWQEKLDEIKEDGIAQEIYNSYLPGTPAPGKIAIFTEDNPPQNYRNTSGLLTGSSVEMVQELLTILGEQDPITLTTWTDAYAQLQLVPNTLVFSTARTTQREELFSWVGPVCKKNYCFFIKTGSAISLTDLNDAKALTSVGVPEGWASEEELRNQGFTNLQTFSTQEVVLENLLNGNLDAAVLNDISIKYITEILGYEAGDVVNALKLASTESYLAFSKGTKQEYIQEWQDAYNTIYSDGKFSSIWSKWYPGIDW